jgi:hypothetical protein
VLTALGFADKQLGMFLQWAHKTDAGAAAGADSDVVACAQLLSSMGAALQAVGRKTGHSLQAATTRATTLVQSATPDPSKLLGNDCKSFAYQLKLAQGRAQRKVDAAELAAADPPASTRGSIGLSFRRGARGRKGPASQSAITTAARAAAADFARAVSGDLENHAVSGDMAIAIEAIDHHREDTFKLRNQLKDDFQEHRRPSNKNSSAGLFGPGTAVVKPQDGEVAAFSALESNVAGVMIELRDNSSKAPSPETPALPSGTAAVEAAAPAPVVSSAVVPLPAVPSAAAGAAGAPPVESKRAHWRALWKASARAHGASARAGPTLSGETKRTHLMHTFDDLMQQLEDEKDPPKSKGSEPLSLELSKTAVKEPSEGDVDFDFPKAKGRPRRRSSVDQLDVDQFLAMELHHFRRHFYPLVHPGSVFQTCWHMAVVAGTIWTGIIVPFSLAFEEAPDGWMATGNVLPWAVFTVDVLLNFATGYNTDGYVVTDFHHISTRYTRTWLLPDLVSILPWDLMFGSSSWQLLKLVRLLRLKELVRVLRIHGIGDYIPDSHMSFMDACGSVVRTLFALICVVHWSACVYFVLAKQEFYDFGFRACEDPGVAGVGRCSNWLPSSELMDSDDILLKYNFAFFAMVSLTAGLGPGTHWPVHGVEIVFTSIMVVIGVFVISITIGNVTSAIAHMKSIHNQRTDKWHRIKLYLHSRMVSVTWSLCPALYFACPNPGDNRYRTQWCTRLRTIIPSCGIRALMTWTAMC